MRHFAKPSLKSIALAGCAAIALIHGTAAAQAASNQPVEFAIEAQSLADALTDYALQSGREVYFLEADLAGMRAPALDGTYRPLEAFQLLLSGSGVAYREAENGVLLVGDAYTRRADDADADRTTSSQSASSGATNAAVAVGSAVQISQPMGPTGEAGEPGIVRGVVRAADANAGLDGALITIEETGQTTSTDDLGRFRFANVPAGRYTVTVSYLGFAESSQVVDLEAGGDVTLPFQLASALDVIVVRGSRSARAQALNQERTAANISTVLSSDFLGQFDGTTISEALRRAPGIAFEQDEVTGDGTNVIVRGLAPDLNTVTLNGLRVPDGSGTGRSADLGNILTESISEITINKTLLPSQDSSGTGGLIEIETKGPLDRARRFANFSIQGSERAKDFNDEFLASGTVSGVFGKNDNFGLSFSAQYREEDIRRLSYNITARNFGQYAPLQEDGTPLSSPTGVDPRVPFPFEPGVDELYPTFVRNGLNGASTSNLTLSASGQTRIADHTELRFDVSRVEQQRDSFDRTTLLNPSGAYQLLPIDELGGEERWALVAEDLRAAQGVFGVQISPSQTYNFVRDREDTTTTLSFRGETSFDQWDFDYSLGYAEGTSTTPLTGTLGASPPFATSSTLNFRPFLLPEALQNTVSDGRIVSPFAPLSGEGYPLPLLTPAGFDLLNDASNYQISFGNLLTGNAGSNERFTARFSARKNFERERLKYIEAGVFYERSEFVSPPVFSDQRLVFFPIGPTTLADVGLGFSGDALEDIGLQSGLQVISQADIASFFSDLSTTIDGIPTLSLLNLEDFAPNDPRLLDAFSREEDLAAYIEAQVNFDKLEIVGGLRLDQVKVSTRNLRRPQLTDENGFQDIQFQIDFANLVDQEATQTKLLPRVAATYRYTDNLVFRAGFSQAVARPQIEQLSSLQSVSLRLVPDGGPSRDRPTLTVRQGNPDLEPALTSNYDLSVENYFDTVGLFKFSVFYKSIENLLESNRVAGLDVLDGIVLPDDPRFNPLPANIFVNGSRPRNAEDDAEIWGFETTFERQLVGLPGIWNGLGVSANYTFTDSSKSEFIPILDPVLVQFVDVEITDVNFSGAPEHSGTVAVTYNKYGLDAALSYTAQSRRLSSFAPYNLSIFDEQDDSLDFRGEYRFERYNTDWRVWLAGSDLLKGADDPDVQSSIGGVGSTPKYFTGGNYFGGRVITLGLGVSF